MTNPDFGGSASGNAGRWNPLPGTAREAEMLAKLLARGHFLSGADVSKRALTNHPRPIILHVATHGEFLPNLAGSSFWLTAPEESVRRGVVGFQVDDNPLLRSRLVMAGANDPNSTADTHLTAMEVSGLDLQGTELVTLSACSTGIGEVQAGDGVYGMRRAFWLAGARSLLISLWRVDDDRTAELMSRFYARLFRGQKRSEALCDVQREFINEKDLSHPRYWASFILTGDTNEMRGLAPFARDDV
jgi:CHAT domain-containing protein